MEAREGKDNANEEILNRLSDAWLLVLGMIEENNLEEVEDEL